jgi:carbon-monoxide dehydrogenase large subunit
MMRGRQTPDERLIRGKGRFVSDVRVPGALEMAVKRSPYAAARILSVDVARARRLPGVVGVLTAVDLPDLPGPIPLYVPAGGMKARTPFPLARERVRYVGEPLAAVLAVDRAHAEDALDAIAVDYVPEPAVVDTLEALQPGAPLVHPDLGTNLAASVTGRVGDPDGAFRCAHHVARVELRLARQSPQPLEPRGIVASWDASEQRLTVWDSTQSPYMVRRILAYLLQLPEECIRVVACDVGGGFGGKNRFYPEEYLASYLAILYGRPVRWIADRREDLLAMYQEREQVQAGELAVTAEGKILGLRIHIIEDAGAYTPFGLVTAQMTVINAMGPYRIPHFEYTYSVVYTNKPGSAAYRGAGRPQGTFLIERLLDRAARDLGLDPVEIRLKNLITPDEQPYDTGLWRDCRRIVYDGGDYPAAYRRALEMIGYANFPVRKAFGREHGRFLGIGTAVAIEVASTSTAEGARITVDRNGHVTVYTGAVRAGQGLERALVEICASRLGVPPRDVTVVMGDTLYMPFGGGTWASRSAVAAGNAVAAAADAVREKAVSLAAAFLEVAPSDLEVVGGVVRVRGTPSRAIELGVLAEASSYPNLHPRWRWPLDRSFPWGDAPGLEAFAFFRPDLTYSYGAHAAIVEVDTETGEVNVLDYAVVHDCGRILNMANVEGQVVGGVVQGIGAALFEQIVFDVSGQLLTGTLMDYAMPRALHVPRVRVDHLQTRAQNPLGVKGVGEGGIIPVAAVICGAIDDALAHLGVFCDRIPVTPEWLFTQIRLAELRGRVRGEKG